MTTPAQKTGANKAVLEKAIIQKAFLRARDGFYISDLADNPNAWLMDFRRIMLEPDILRAYLDLFWEEMAEEDTFQVGGLESAALPLIGAIVADSARIKAKEVSGFFIRKSRKETGLLQKIEGTIEKEKKIILIDDIINNGKSLERSIKILQEAGHSVSAIFTIIRFRDRDFYDKIESLRGIQIISLFELKDFASSLGLSNQQEDRKGPVPRPFKVSWYFKSDGARHQFVIPKSAPAIDQKKVYFGSDAGVFWALSRKDGKPVWHYRIPFGSRGKMIFSSPCLYKKNVYFGAYDGNLYALNAETGAVEWIYPDADWVGSSPVVAQDKGLILVGLEYGLFKRHGGMAAINAKTGTEVWKQVTPDLVHATPGYSIKYEFVVCGSNDGVVRAFRVSDGTTVWEVTTGASVRYGVAFDDDLGLTAFGSEDGNLYIVDTRTGVPRHTFRMMGGMYSTPLFVGGKIYAASLDKHLYCVDAVTGKEVWRFQTNGRIFSSPVFAFDHLYIGSNDGSLYELDPHTGENTALFTTSERIVNKVAFDEATGEIFLPTAGNEIYCLSRAK